jgi:hypothetical protein
VPAGLVAIVRNVDILNATGQVANAGLSVGGYYMTYGPIQAHSDKHVESRNVAYAGEQVIGIVDLSGMTLVAAGYLFQDDGGYRPSFDVERIPRFTPEPLPWP